MKSSVSCCDADDFIFPRKISLWIATADIKDMYVDSGGRDMVPFLKVLATLIGKGVEIRRVGH